MNKVDFQKKYILAGELLNSYGFSSMTHDEISHVFHAFLEAKRIQEEIGADYSKMSDILNKIEKNHFTLIPSLRKDLVE